MNITIVKTIEYLNSVTNADFSPDFPDTVNLLNKLIELGYNLTDFKLVIDKKWGDWQGTKFQNYVRPSTLFGKNFENYLNEKRTPKNAIQQLSIAVSKAKQTNWRLDSE